MTPAAFAGAVCAATLAVRWEVGLPVRGVADDGTPVRLVCVYTPGCGFDLEVAGRPLALPAAAEDIFAAYLTSISPPAKTR